MKLRIQATSVRFRLNRKDVETLRSSGSIQDRLAIHDETGWTYGLLTTSHENFTLPGTGCELLVGVPAPVMQHWLETDQVGLYADVERSRGGRLAISIEKDFVCLGTPEEQRDPHAYPHPEPQNNC